MERGGGEKRGWGGGEKEVGEGEDMKKRRIG